MLSDVVPLSASGNLVKFPSRSFSNSKILLVGDVMLDSYVYGDVTRICPEAPVPIVNVTGGDYSIGAAANCARNITALGDKVTLVSVVGDDENGRIILDKIGQDHLITPYIFPDSERVTTVKTRYLSGYHQMLRADTEEPRGIRENLQERVISVVKSEIMSHDVLILSDYDKGVLTGAILAELIQVAKAAGKPVIVDPKKTDWNLYSGATVVTPNLHEWFIANGVEYSPGAASTKLKRCGIDNILVTRSKFGMTLIEENGVYSDIPAVAKHIIDVTGAGDTAVAVLALGMASGLSMLEAATLANKAAGIVVGKPKTATVTQEELFG